MIQIFDEVLFILCRKAPENQNLKTPKEFYDLNNWTGCECGLYQFPLQKSASC